MAGMPSIPQMLGRSNSGHHKALAHIAAGHPLTTVATPVSSIRGLRVVLATLHRWDAIKTHRDGAGIWHSRLTERGCQLLEALDARYPNQVKAVRV